MKTLLLLALCSFSSSLWAACGLPAASASLGSVTSFAVNQSGASTTGNINVNCGSGNLLALLSTNYISVSLTSASPVSGTRGALTRPGGDAGDSIPLRLCASSNCASELTIGGAGTTFNSSQLLNLVGLLGGANFTLPLTLQTLPGANVAAGTYTGTLVLAVEYRICRGLGVGGLCILEERGQGAQTMTVTITVTNDCNAISAPEVNFGSAPLVQSFRSISQSISVICTKGSSYSVGISNGSYAAGNQRNMASGNNRLSYEIYKATGGERWGPTGSERWLSSAASGVTSDGLTRTYSYRAEINPNQPTPPAGVYSDNLVVDLSF